MPVLARSCNRGQRRRRPTGPQGLTPKTMPNAPTEQVVLGIETSCDETAAAVVRRDGHGHGTILSNVVRSQVEAHMQYGGVVPEIAARAHVEIIDTVVAAALKDAGIDCAALTGVAATAGPGLIGGVLVGLVTGKALAFAAGKPFVGINHLEGHALTVGLTDGLRPPYLLLLVSGGHTQTLVVRDAGSYQRLGTTVDDALGEAFDKTAKLLGLGYPGGPAVAAAALEGDPARFALPRPMLGREAPHFSFAGLKTAVRQQAEKLVPLTGQDVADICASFEQAVTDAVADRVRRAMRLYEEADANGARTLVVAGGVAANVRLKARLEELVLAENYSLVVAPPALCTDNAAMIAWAGAERFSRGEQDDFSLPARARWPLDAAAPAATGAGVKA